MRDVEIARLAGTQHNRVARRQLRDLGLSDLAIDRRVRTGRLVIVEKGVLAVPPVLDDVWGTWMAATLTQPNTYLSRVSTLAANGLWDYRRPFETVTRPGNGGPRRHGGLRVHRSQTLDGDCTELNGVPTTTVPRALVDTAPGLSERALARAVREAVRKERTTLIEVGDALGKHHRRRGSRKLARVIARYSGLPLEHARSGAEIRALEVLRGAGRSMPRLNTLIAGEEADLAWPEFRLIIEIDGGPFHKDKGEDARKEVAWGTAGWKVLRIPSDDVYDHPGRLLILAP